MSDQTVILGMGFKSDAPLSALENAARTVCYTTGLVPDVIATLASKVGHPPFIALAEKLNARIIALDPDDIRGVPTSTVSQRIQALFGTGSVAEAVAIAAIPGATLQESRKVSTDNATTATATAALALAPRKTDK